MPTANEEIQDRAISHAVNVEKFSNATVRKILQLLVATNDRLANELRTALEKLPANSFSVKRLESLLYSSNALLTETFKQANAQLQLDLKDFAEYEASFQSMTLSDALPAFVNVGTVTGSQVYAAATARPFQGVLLKDALADVDSATQKRIQQTILNGVVENRTNEQIIREIRGTKAANYSDGLLEVSRRDAEAIVRSSVQSVAGVAQDRVAEENADIIKGVRWTATLDLRTSDICRIRDNCLYTVKDHKPIKHSYPWLSGPGRSHWRCRSAQTQVLKSWQEMGLDIEGDPNLSSTRASLDGQVPAEKSYTTWLKQQTYERQVEVLGETRAKLMSDGNLSMTAMYSQRGEFLTLDELRKREAKAFKRAGL